MASDGEILAQGKVDVRRFTRVNIREIVAISYFKQKKNKWVNEFLNDYMNLKMSEEGHERSKLLVEALGNIGRQGVPQSKKRDERGWVQRNVTARNKGPEDE